MRTLLIATLASCGLLGACSQPSGPPAHVVLITVDTLRADHLSMNGYERATSPRLDAFAEEALHYEQAVAVLPKTGPAMTTHLTGRGPCQHGVTANHVMIPAEVPMVAELFKAAGYRTAAFVSNPVLSVQKGYSRGFDVYREFAKAGGLDRLNRQALKWLGKQDWVEPTFVWLHYIDPHGPYTPKGEYKALFQDDAIARADARTLPTTYERLEGSPANYAHGVIPAYQQLGDENRVAFYIASYDAEIRYMDDAVGEILDFLRERELFDELGIVFTADHGESLGEHDYWFEHGRYAYEACQRIPMIVKPPRGMGGTPGQRLGVQVSNLDTTPTLLAMAGIEANADLMGRSLLEPSTADEPLFIQNCSSYPDRFSGVRVPPFKFLRDIATGAEQLFDLSADPYETRNLIDESPDVVDRLRALYTMLADACQRRSMGESVEVTPDAETLRLLGELGYAGDH